MLSPTSSSLQKRFGPLPAHASLRLSLRFFRMDAWAGETASVSVDGAVGWRSAPLHVCRAGEGSCAQACGGTSSDEWIDVQVHSRAAAYPAPAAVYISQCTARAPAPNLPVTLSYTCPP